MMNPHDMEMLIRTYQKEAHAWRKTLRNSMFVLALVVVILAFEALSFFDAVDARFDIVVFVILGVAGVLFIIGLMVYLFYVSERPLYEHVMPKVVEGFNAFESEDLTYTAYPKKAGMEERNKNAGLFTRGAFVKNRFAIEGTSPEGIPYTLYDTHFVVSTGNASSVVFNGYYYILKQKHDVFYQIRTRGRPSLKGVSFTRVKQAGKVSLFVEAGERVPKHVEMMLDHAQKLFEDDRVKHLYISALEETVHVAIEPHKMDRRKRTMTQETLHQLTEQIAFNHRRVDRLLVDKEAL